MDNRRARSEATRQALMRAAEKLVAEQGIENVSIRDIVKAAGQKNESALQYHFKNLSGLLAALHASRDAEVQARRTALIEETLAASPQPTLREICKLMVAPAFELASASASFRRYVKAFGHEITLADESALALVNRKGGQSAEITGELLRDALPNLDEAAFRRRLDGALRYVAAAMVHHAGRKNAFQGPEADLFFHSLIDGLVGLLSAPESDETRAASRSFQRRGGHRAR